MGIILVDVHLNKLHWFCFFFLLTNVLFILIDCVIFLLPPRCYMDVYVNSFFPYTAKLWNSLLAECISLTYDKKDIFLSLGFFQTALLHVFYLFFSSFFCNSMPCITLQISISLPVTMIRKIKKTQVKLKFWWSN